MRRTAWLNASYEDNPALRPKRQSDRADLITAFYMLAYLGAADMALLDLEQELQDANLYRHGIKRMMTRTMQVVGNANGLASDILKEMNHGVRVRQHSDTFEYAYNKIQENVLLTDQPLNRAYSIVKALARLFSEAYNKVGRKTNHYYLQEASVILSRLDIPQLKDFNLDPIISNNVRINCI